METKTKKFDVTIIGAGVTGLFLTLKLIKLGIKVLLLEANDVIAKGPSVRNEGWVHFGSYHSYGIEEENVAIKVAKNCMYGANQILQDFPECVEEPFAESVVLIKRPENVKKAEYRWRKAGVFHERLSRDELETILHDINIPSGAVGFRVKEKAINTRMLYQLVFQKIKIIGNVQPEMVCIRTGVEDIRFAKNKKVAMIQFKDDTSLVIDSKMYIYTAGAGTKDIFEREHPNIPCPMRVFQSHLLVAPRLSEHNVFYVEEGEITAMGHGKMTIIGSTKDNDEIRAIKNYAEAEKAREDKLVAKTRELFKTPLDKFTVYSCHKVDVGEMNGFQSLEPKIHEDKCLKNHIICCPGKMTEAPVLVDKLIHTIFARINNSQVAERPLDEFEKICSK